ncbi:zinc finger protein 268 isoform X4 [Carlito syrichta]|uniref:Zinc finger protein 268 isoform X4 n=1 Tax=Carlito syrichta TaxID=1868482 RepID=A0A3Q0E9G4_CARSF|nr:zinc finger protein 268 isoform X4 [Carlito syrichta]
MAARVRTASIWVPPLQEQDGSCDRIRKLQGQESILGQGILDVRPLLKASGQRQKSHRTEKVLEWLFISPEHPKITKSWTKCGKPMTIWNGIKKIKGSWEVQQKTMNALHLENCVFLVQIMFL